MSAIMKPSAIYRKAARLMERRAKSIWNVDRIEYACEAIDTAIGVNSGGNCELCCAMRSVFDPENKRGVWLDGISSDDGDIEDDRSGRILALCFMAAIAEDSET